MVSILKIATYREYSNVFENLLDFKYSSRLMGAKIATKKLFENLAIRSHFSQCNIIVLN